MIATITLRFLLSSIDASSSPFTADHCTQSCQGPKGPRWRWGLPIRLARGEFCEGTELARWGERVSSPSARRKRKRILYSSSAPGAGERAEYLRIPSAS
jgi:hypothetical protein